MLKTPPLQTATATIDTLCGRLQSATLLEDRRAAILGLRSFAKQYPASVASGSLRELITTLRKDGLGEVTSTKSKDAEGRGEEGGDVDTIRLVLETLIMLFNPDSSSPEASDEIALFMADEFAMRQDNISLLLNLLDPTSPFADYYSRLYTVQLLSAVCAARPDRLQECILGAPLGTSRVVGVLDDGRDAVRNAGLLLLVDLTGGANEELRKIVAFEDVFAKVFALIKVEGGLADAGIAGQDCLSLLANLVRGSASNQAMFRESGCVGQLTQLLQEIMPPTTPEARFIAESREKAGWGVLQLMRMFFLRGESSTPQNQTAFFRAGTAQLLLDVGFHSDIPAPIRSMALKSASDLISDNPQLQEAFAPLQVAVVSAGDMTPASIPQTNGSRSAGASARNSARPSAEHQRTYVIEALLELTLNQPRADASLRGAGCGLIQAYLAKHDRIKAHFLQRAIAGHKEGEENANVLTGLLQPSADTSAIVFAGWIIQDLVADLPDAKQVLAAVVEGDESEGEDVLTAIQTLGSQLESSLQTSAEDRVIATYASTLTLLVWDFAPGINDLLAEASSLLQQLIITASDATAAPTTSGLAATLVGTIYEFSTKDSPIPRRTLAPLLTQKLTRNKYLTAVLNLRRDPAIRDFGLQDSSNPEDYLNETFVDLFLTEYPRLRKAIDKDPGVEVLPASAAHQGVDRDILDDLRGQLSSASSALATAQQEAVENTQRHDQERLSLQKDAQTAVAEVERLKRINQAMQHGHEEDSQKSLAQHQRDRETLQIEHARVLADSRREAERQTRQAREQSEQSFAARVQSYEQKIAEMGNQLRSESGGHAQVRQQLEALQARFEELVKREQEAETRAQQLGVAHEELQRAHAQVQNSASESATALELARAEGEKGGREVEGLRREVRELKVELESREVELASERKGFGELEREFEGERRAAEDRDGEAAERVGELEGLSESLAVKVRALQDELGAVKKAAADAAAKSATESNSKGKGKGKGKVAGDTAEVKAAAEESERARREVEKVKQSEKEAREELEGLLLVMGEIEAKRDEYREKVREMGGEVTEDEDEESEEGDGDETLD